MLRKQFNSGGRVSSSRSSSSGMNGGDSYGGRRYRTSRAGAGSAAAASGFGFGVPPYAGDEDDWRGRSDGAQAIHQLVMRCCWGPRRT